ncbi:hypothetical protein [Acinetobacter soli]|uniref:hypothetical protein n=1 Tax=Acinetobacter soli TaxID=487316 RepID=UPI001250841A|nr:hypothetical protein [Acinetobacter soli]
MTDKSKWFVYKLENGDVFGCFRLKPFSDKAFQNALTDLGIKKRIFKFSEVKYGFEFLKIVAIHLIQDWENIAIIDKDVGEGGSEETRYTPENAFNLLTKSELGFPISSWILKKSQSISS